MKLSSWLFEAYLRCPTKCYLRSIGQAGSGNAYAEWVGEQNDAYRKEGVQRLVAAAGDGVAATTPGAANLKAATWRLAVDLTLETETMGSRLHAVERVPSQGRGKPAQFIPVRFTFFNKLTKDDRLLLAFDALLLSEALGREVGVGKIIHGDDHTSSELKLPALLKLARKHIRHMTAALRDNSPPDLVLNRHCPECIFQSSCRRQASEKDDLSLLPAMTQKERGKLHSKGIFTIHQLSFTFRPRKAPKRAKNPSNPRHHALQAQAIREQTVYVHGNPQLPSSERCLYFDIEGVPWRESYYLIGVLAVEADAASYHAFWSDGGDQSKMVSEFCQFVGSYHNARLFHYGHYDVKALRDMQSLVSQDEKEALGTVISACFNVLPVVHSYVYFPLHSIRLRQVAGFLGFTFTSEIGAGIESITFRERWLKSGDQHIKNALIKYNREDCEALRKVCDFLRDVVGLAGAKSRVPGRTENVVLTDQLRKPGEGNRPAFKKAEFVLPEFEKVNRCAYFDYQRDKVYVRKKRKVVAPKRCKSHTVRHPSQDTEVILKCSTCTQCGSRRLSLQKPLIRRLIDLKFFKTGIGVKRWQPKYIINRYLCRSCGSHLTAPGLVNPKGKAIYGHNLMCWVVYHSVVCKQSLLQVERSLDDIFDLRLPFGNANRLRSKLTAYYRPLRDEIMAAILGERVINIDETPVNLRKTTGYVWVLATGDKVYYLYKESREGSFLKDLLADFSGVLVADFFTAYDSLKCRHQKCLVHLMRDINDDLRRHPFDEELRYVAQEFGIFLTSVVSTIDRWGLKAQHLHKHIKAADRLLREIGSRAFTSEQAIKYQRRFSKYAESLFEFLHHDNVPWNNNNAEHAVHYFAKVRRFTDGTFTSSSIEELLTLVTVIQTCEYRGVNPLKFLLSGETSLSGMAKGRRSGD
jgi:predicted RecB family nuclease